MYRSFHAARIRAYRMIRDHDDVRLTERNGYRIG